MFIFAFRNKKTQASSTKYMKTPPIDRQLIERLSTALGIEDFERATIREIKALAAEAERISGVEFIKMEMGVPGLPACALGIETETAALQSGVASLYADMEGIPELKAAASRFLKTFTGIELSPMGCIPVVGSMQGSYAAFTTCLQCHDSNKRILFIDPGFPVQKLQLKVMGAAFESFDVHDYRGNKLRDKLESYLKEGNVAALIYSNPNNPSWFNFKDEELRLIGETAARYDTTVIEDLAYFGMDFRPTRNEFLCNPAWQVIATTTSCCCRPRKHSVMPDNASACSACPTSCTNGIIRHSTDATAR